MQTQQIIHNHTDTLEKPVDAAPGSVTMDPMALSTVTTGSKNEDIYSLTYGGHIFKLNKEKQWDFINTGKFGFKDISCAKNGDLFAVAGHDNLLHQYIEGQFIKITIDHNVPLSHIKAITGKKVLGVGLGDNLPVVLDIKHGTDASTLKRPSWVRFGNVPLKNIACGSKQLLHKMEIWGLGVDDYPYRFDDSTDKWYKVGDVKMRLLDISTDNVVYGVTATDGLLFKWNSKDKFSVVEKAESKCREVNLVSISSYKESRAIHAIDGKSGNLIKLRGM
ncbi:hypothetical protein AKO1_011291 [Acrasis kona]|uniref:Uncharacterized protein n=1 Tax=Acrasis kona TaxID=1008807 RepID=A0AAW2YXV1_9EUKA